MKQNQVFLFLIILFLVGLFSSSIYSADVVGTVTDTENGLPISNVIVKIIETGDSTITDINGNYFISNVVDGSYTLLVGGLNYTPIVFTRTIGSCCIGIRGNVNGDILDEINISDLVFLVGYMFQNGATPPCIEEADINASGGTAPINISDIVAMVAYMFQGGASPAPCF